MTDEKIKISRTFTEIDRKISLSERELDALENGEMLPYKDVKLVPYTSPHVDSIIDMRKNDNRYSAFLKISEETLDKIKENGVIYQDELSNTTTLIKKSET